MSHCSVCKHISSKTVLYICKSGHVLCKNCQNNGLRQDGGDTMKQSKKVKNDKKRTRTSASKKQGKKSLASGDCNINVDEGCTPTKPLMETSAHGNGDSEDKITVIYKNKNCQGSASSVNSKLVNNVYFEDNAVIPKNNPVPRPISCPVCNKMIAIHSIMFHFYFDHSKLPRVTIALIPQRILLKAPDFDVVTKCLTILTLEKDRKYGDCLTDPNDPIFARTSNNLNNRSFFLMGAKICSSDNESTAFQIDKHRDNFTKKQGSDDSSITYFNDTDNILMWICKIVENEIICEVTLRREDKKMSFSYAAEAPHIRDKQDVHTMYQNACCLILRGNAVNRLIDADGQFSVFVVLR